MLERFSRQMGLVDQNIVSSLRIATKGLPKQLQDSFSSLSEQLGIEDFPSSYEDAEYIIQASESTNKLDVSTISVSYGQDGIFLDGRVSKEAIHSLFEPAVAIIAASLCLNEVLRRSGSFLPIEIPKVSVSVNLRVDTHTIAGPLEELKFSIDDHKSSMNILDTNDGTSQHRILLRLDDDDPITQQLRERLRVSNGRDTSFPATPCIDFNIPIPEQNPQGHVTLIGAGGLGTWVLKTMVEGLSKVEIGPLSILLFDKDSEIEKHNLNRQVIFNEDDIGKPKAQAAGDWLHRNLPSAEIKLADELKDRHLLDMKLVDEEDGISLDDLEEHEVCSSESINLIDDDEIRSLLKSTDVIIGCLDAMHPRTLADLAAARMNQPYVNAGVQGLFANFCEFQNSSLVSKHGKQVANDRVVMSCPGDGDIPVSSIVLTNALAASFQAIAALQRLSGSKYASIGTVNWKLRKNEIWCIESEGEVSRRHLVSDIESALWPTKTKINEDSKGVSTGKVVG